MTARELHVHPESECLPLQHSNFRPDDVESQKMDLQKQEVHESGAKQKQEHEKEVIEEDEVSTTACRCTHALRHPVITESRTHTLPSCPTSLSTLRAIVEILTMIF